MKDMFNNLGVIKPIIQARSMATERIPVDLEFFISRWSNETHTFVASWGEFGPSLEDVARSTSLSMFDEAHGTSLYPDGEDKKRIDLLTNLCRNRSIRPIRRYTYSARSILMKMEKGAIVYTKRRVS